MSDRVAMSRLCDPTILQIVLYPHPTLRHRSKPVRRVDAQLRDTVRRMFELMYEARGVGLAANQVDLPLRLFVMNTTGNPEEGTEQVFINPVLSRPRGMEEGDEGCLSLPDVHGPVVRNRRIRVQAFGLDGQEIHTDLEGLTARIVQHETDHLDGVLFTDRLSTDNQAAVVNALDEFDREFTSRRQMGEIPSDAEIAQRLSEWEQRYC